MQKIYNEGRVVGLSAYELYVRHTLVEYPDNDILTEREWLAATLGDGVSMILKVAGGTSAGVHDYPLPGNSTLCAANTITASIFNGTVDIDKSNKLWATKVTSYGPLIDNSARKSPTTPGEEANQVPTKDLLSWDDDNIHMLRDYLKVIDGVTFQPGTWTASGTAPAKDFNPDLSKPSVVRLRFSKAIESDLYILLTGFLFRPIVAGLSKMDTGSINTQRPQNGDFLGVEVYPWANKIVFTVPSEVFNAINHRSYVRKIDIESIEKSVPSHAIIDYETSDPKNYYQSTDSDSQIDLNVEDLNIVGESASVLASYQRNQNYPPVLFGAKVSSTGAQKLCPVDIAAPGHVKVFTDKDLAKNYVKVYPNTFAMYKDIDNDVFMVNDDGSMTSLSCDVDVVDHAQSSGYAMEVTAGDVSRKALSLQDKEGNDLPLAGSASTSIDTSNVSVSHNSWINGSAGLSWSNLVSALRSNKLIDVLGSALRTFRSNLPNIVSGDNGVLTIKGTGASSIAGSLTVKGNTTLGDSTSDTTTMKGSATVGSTMTAAGAITSTGGTLKSGTQYVTLKNGLRLYISNTMPTDADIPDGSIGIGW